MTTKKGKKLRNAVNILLRNNETRRNRIAEIGAGG
jgi:hypothetical protein